jgi:hypothetical protein
MGKQMISMTIRPTLVWFVFQVGAKRKPEKEEQTTYRVGPDDWVSRLEFGTHVLRGPSLAAVQGEAVPRGRLLELGLRIGPRQGLEELLVRRRDPVVDLVARGPEGVAARPGQLGQAQDGVVAGDGLKGDVAVPAALAALLPDEAVRVELLVLLRRDDADVVVLAAQATAAVGDRVDVQLGGGGLARELTKALDELLLEVVVEVILLAEEDHTSTRDLGTHGLVRT